jgi:hypothetical protein
VHFCQPVCSFCRASTGAAPACVAPTGMSPVAAFLKPAACFALALPMLPPVKFMPRPTPSATCRRVQCTQLHSSKQYGHVPTTKVPLSAACEGTCSVVGIAPSGTPCNDGHACTVKDMCIRGVCVGKPKCPPSQKPCIATCDPTTGGTDPSLCTPLSQKVVFSTRHLS